MKKAKKILSGFVATATLVCSIFIGSTLQPITAAEITYGDVNLDGEITPDDVELALAYVRNNDLDLSDIQISAASLGLGEVNAINAAMILKKAKSLDYKFPNGDTGEYVDVSGLAETTVFVLGDSTACDYAATADSNYYYKRVGFGTALPNYFNEEKVTVNNLAISGISSKSFTSNANYTTLLSEMKEGDYVLIAFGHNDEKIDDSTRYTAPGGTKEDEGTFKYSLYQNYITKIQAAGATPILCTPVVRRTTSDTFSDTQLHKTNGGDYAQDIRDLGEELGLTVIDNTALTQALYTELTPDETLYLHAWPSASSVDNTHLNNYGANMVAYMMANALKETDNSLKNYVKNSITEPTKTEYLIVNPDYVESTADDYNLGEQTLFDVTNGWIATAFGNIGGSPNTSNFTVIETNASENEPTVESVELAVSNNKGKLAGGSDGFLLYVREDVPVSDSFEISATAVVNSYDENSQVGFGVIVADSILINENTGDGYTTPYVAAGYKIGTDSVNSMIGFYRDENGSLNALSTGTLNENNPVVGSEIYLKINKTGNKYTVTINDAVTEYTAEYEDLVFPGVFVARNADITFKNVYYNNEVVES